MIYKTQQSAFSAGNNYIESPIFYPESAREIEPEKRVVAIFDVPADDLIQRITGVFTFVEIEVDGVIVPNDLYDYQFDSAGLHTVKYTLPNDDTIPTSAFNNCSSIVSITIPDNAISIGKEAFLNCRSLVSVTIGRGITTIGHNAFCGCLNIASVMIPDNVTSIDNTAFSGCYGLTSITIGSGVTTIGNAVFANCINLSTITSHIMNAPDVVPGTFYGVKNNGTLYVPIGSSGYETWMSDEGNLGYHNWTKVEQ